MFFKFSLAPFFLITLLVCAIPAKAESVQELNVQQVYQMMASDNVVVIDNRHIELFKDGHIPGALNMEYFRPSSPQNIMTKEMLEPFQGRALIFYCSGALRAYHAAQRAIEWDISPDIYWFKGGWPEWQDFINSLSK